MTARKRPASANKRRRLIAKKLRQLDRMTLQIEDAPARRATARFIKAMRAAIAAKVIG